MNLTLQQLELYTALGFPEWMPEDDLERINLMFRQRGHWRFTHDQLRRYLEEHQYLIERYFCHCADLVGIHEKVVLTREGERFYVYDQGHGKKVDVEEFKSKTEAVLKWLECRCMN